MDLYQCHLVKIVKKRYEACNWQVLEVKDGNDINEIHKAIKKR